MEYEHSDFPRTECPVRGNGTNWWFESPGLTTSTHSGAVAASKSPSMISTGTSLSTGALIAGSASGTSHAGHSWNRRPCFGWTLSTRSGKSGSTDLAYASASASVVRLALSEQKTVNAKPGR